MADPEFCQFHFDLNDLVMMLEQFLKQAINHKKIIFNRHVRILTSFEILADDGRLLIEPLPRLSNLEVKGGDCVRLKNNYTTDLA